MSISRVIIPVILAAGESRRMGFPKALLNIKEKSFIRHIIDLYNSLECEMPVVVLGAQAEDVQKDISGLNARCVVNKNYASGQLSSIVAGIESAERFDAEAILVHPVDHPLVSVGVITSLITAFDKSTPPIVLPVYRGRRGHPVLFWSRVFDELKLASPDIGARTVVWSHARDVREVETQDEGVILDVDTPEEYRRLRNIRN